VARLNLFPSVLPSLNRPWITKGKGDLVSLRNLQRNDPFAMATPTKPNNRVGPYVRKTFKDESFLAYVAPPLPPDPPLMLPPLLPLLGQANQALGRLDGLASILPDPSQFTCTSGRTQCSPRRSKERSHRFLT
jgi:hypothetical protein